MSSDAGLPRQDRPRLATFHACTPDHQLGLFGRVDIPTQTQSAILFFVRRRVSLFFLPRLFSHVPSASSDIPLLVPLSTLSEIQRSLLEMTYTHHHVSLVVAGYII